jgi:hypothetical protein
MKKIPMLVAGWVVVAAGWAGAQERPAKETDWYLGTTETAAGRDATSHALEQAHITYYLRTDPSYQLWVDDALRERAAKAVRDATAASGADPALKDFGVPKDVTFDTGPNSPPGKPVGASANPAAAAAARKVLEAMHLTIRDFSEVRYQYFVDGSVLETALVTAKASPDFNTADYLPIDGTTFLGGADSLRIVQAATTVQVYRIYDPEDGPVPKNTVKRDGFACSHRPVTPNGPDVAALVRGLPDMRNYGPELNCGFDPGILVRMIDAKGSTFDIVACFFCGEIQLFRDGKIVVRPVREARSQSTCGGLTMHALRVISQKAFPNDPAFQE